MSRKKKRDKGKHTEWCKCYECNDGFLIANKWKKGEQEIIAKEIKKTTTAIQAKLKQHTVGCLCVNCVVDKKTATPTLDHTMNCVCYKCKKDKDMGKTGVATSYTSSSYTACHEGNVFIFKMDGISVFGAGNLKDAEPGKVDIVLDLDRNVKASTWADDLPKHFKSRKRATSKVRVLDLFIKDMNAPEHVTAEFWVDFWQDLVEEGKKLGKQLKVLVMCQGGHGRTGVVVASLIMASAYNKKNIPENVHPVGWLRKQYCDKAVESLKQTEYLTRVWGMRFVSASKSSSTFYKANTTGSGSKDDNKAPPDSEIPDENSKCYMCKSKRTQKNRILFSADVKEFECDNCFGIRADNDDEAEELEESNKTASKDDARYDQTQFCEGNECYDTYNDVTQIWTTIHTYKDGCDVTLDENCEGQMCGFHSNSMSEGWVHTYDQGCIAKKGEQGLVAEMTDEEYAIWAETII